LVASQKADDEVRFLEGITSEHEGFAHSSRHMEKFKSNTSWLAVLCRAVGKGCVSESWGGQFCPGVPLGAAFSRL